MHVLIKYIQKKISIVLWLYTFISVFMGSVLSLYQYQNQKSCQILHDEPTSLQLAFFLMLSSSTVERVKCVSHQIALRNNRKKQCNDERKGSHVLGWGIRVLREEGKPTWPQAQWLPYHWQRQAVSGDATEADGHVDSIAQDSFHWNTDVSRGMQWKKRRLMRTAIHFSLQHPRSSLQQQQQPLLETC